jgi:integral membrane protein (TIGR01906 family)
MKGRLPLERTTLVPIVRWLIVISMPLLLGFGTIRAIIAWDYPGFEYARIPPDLYGFTPEQRLDLAHATLDYLRRPEPSEEVIHLLEELRLPDSNQLLYNEREIGHMLDVKDLTDILKRIVWVAAAVIIIGVIWLVGRAETRLEGYRAIFHGGIATTVVLLAIALFILLAWNVFFVQFHQLLFPPDTWSFAYSDGLIRLFPEQFWFDFGVIVSVGTFLEGVVVAAIGYLLLRSG